jgi:hypothetical protein
LFKFCFPALAALTSVDVQSQGCSDAGFCTVHSIKTKTPTDTVKNFKNQFKAGFSYGMAQNKIAIYTPYGEFTRKLYQKMSLTVKLLYAVHHGDLATTFGISDAVVTTDYHLTERLQFIAGMKIPFNDANKKKNELSLPMGYQISLGSTDMILGLSYVQDAFILTTAYQQPLIQNKNGFDITDYPEGMLQGVYYSTNDYERKGDVLLRVSRHVRFRNNKYLFIPSILPIYHLGNDSYLDNTGSRIEIADSNGLTLNLNLFLQYKLTGSTRIELSVGAPVIARKVRPDGLSKFAVGVEYGVDF